MSTLKPIINLSELAHYYLVQLALAKLAHMDTAKSCSGWFGVVVQSNKISGYLYYPSMLYPHGLQPCIREA